MFTFDKYGHWTYAGQHKGGYACGLGVVTGSNGDKIYAEHGPDGEMDGHCFVRLAHGYTGYTLYERGKEKACGFVFPNGRCMYNDLACAPDDPRFLALAAQVEPVKVRLTVPAAHPQSPATRPQAIVRRAGSFCPRRRSQTPWPTRCIPTPHAVPGGSATQANNSRNSTRDHAVTRLLVASKLEVAWEAPPHAPSCTLTTRAHQKPITAASVPWYAQHAAVPNAATLGGLHLCVHTPHPARTPRPSTALPSRTARLPSGPTLRATF